MKVIFLDIRIYLYIWKLKYVKQKEKMLRLVV
jgi:hypothetical protein